MLLLPLLLGIAASRPDTWQLVLAGAALTAYLGSATVQAWSRARRSPTYRAPIIVYGGAFAILSLPLVVTFPPLLLSLVVVVPAGIVVLRGARPGTRRDLANSLAQVAQALVLVPAAAVASGAFAVDPVVGYLLVAAAYLVGSVLVVRSVLRERANPGFAGLSAGFHVALVPAALALLPPAYAVVAALMAARSLALPIVGRRWAGGSHPLRPIHVGLVEMATSACVVIVSFAAPI
jgi:hypothetical protein